MSLKPAIGSERYMNKAIPKNPKYQNVKSKLNTGCSPEVNEKNYRHRSNELVKRLKVTKFAQMILNVALPAGSDLDKKNASDSQYMSDDLQGCEAKLQMSSCQNPHIKYPVVTALLSVVNGFGEMDLMYRRQKYEIDASNPDLAETPYPSCPYLLLDVRERQEYNRCHIIGAHSFPIAMLSRAGNPYTREMLAFKNAPGKIVIVYDEDERIASQAAHGMCQRGFENLFMLSGGLKVIAKDFPEGMTTGSLPASCLLLKGRKFPVQRQRHPQAAENRWRFTSEELAKIKEQLDKIRNSSEMQST